MFIFLLRHDNLHFLDAILKVFFLKAHCLVALGDLLDLLHQQLDIFSFLLEIFIQLSNLFFLLLDL